MILLAVIGVFISILGTLYGDISKGGFPIFINKAMSSRKSAMPREQPKNILITGGGGLIGTALIEHLSQQGYRLYRLSRDSTSEPFFYEESKAKVNLDPAIPLSAVINLAGPSIADKRWTDARKREILESRQKLTAALARALADLDNKPQTLLSASAIGFYGLTGDKGVDESSPAGNDFLAEVGKAWEGATAPAEKAGINTIHLRFGIVLSPAGGVLKKLLLPFSLGLGGRIGSGQQYMSWICIKDVVQIVHKLLIDNPASGPINLVAEQAISNAEFSAELANVLRRPSIFPLPGFVVKLVFGEMGETLLLGSSRVTSIKLKRHGISLQYPTLRSALEALLKSRE